MPSLLGERGAGDAFAAAAAPPLRYATPLGPRELAGPREPTAQRRGNLGAEIGTRSARDRDLGAEIADEIAPSSPRRGWLSLTLNGISPISPLISPISPISPSRSTAWPTLA